MLVLVRPPHNRPLTLIVGQLELFSARVRESLNVLDWTAKRDVPRLMVLHIEIIFRVPPPSRPDQANARRGQCCTVDRRANLRLVRPPGWLTARARRPPRLRRQPHGRQRPQQSVLRSRAQTGSETGPGLDEAKFRQIIEQIITDMPLLTVRVIGPDAPITFSLDADAHTKCLDRVQQGHRLRSRETNERKGCRQQRQRGHHDHEAEHGACKRHFGDRAEGG
jgi:hypothetical protein